MVRKPGPQATPNSLFIYQQITPYITVMTRGEDSSITITVMQGLFQMPRGDGQYFALGIAVDTGLWLMPVQYKRKARP